MPPNTVPEPTVPDGDNPDKELKELCSAIEYLVYKDGDQPELVKHRTYHADTEPDFGIVYDTLLAGSYQVYLLAHQSQKATFSENAFSFDELSDSFYKGQKLQLKEGDETNVDINLQRIVSRIEFKAADKIPEDIVRFELAVSNHPDRLDILTGKGLLGPTISLMNSKRKKKDNPVKSIPFIPLFRQAMKRYPSRSRPPDRIIKYCESGQ